MMRGMGNMQGMMKQMQKLQKEMQSAQEYLDSLEFEGVSANDLVKVKLNGKRQVLDVTVNPEIVDPEDVGMLEDMLVVAIGDALAKVEEKSQAVMGRYTQGLPF